MNKDQIKGAAKETVGKVQKEVGKATANGTEVVKGTARELAGKAQKAYGNAKEDATEEDTPTKRDRDIERHAH